MKKLIIKTAIGFSALTSATAGLAGEVGTRGGGDAIALKIAGAKNAAILLLKNKSISGLNDQTKKLLLNAMTRANVNIETVDQALVVEGLTKDAVTTRFENGRVLIQFNRARLLPILSMPVALVTLTVHEYARVAGLNDESYEISSMLSSEFQTTQIDSSYAKERICSNKNPLLSEALKSDFDPNLDSMCSNMMRRSITGFQELLQMFKQGQLDDAEFRSELDDQNTTMTSEAIACSVSYPKKDRAKIEKLYMSRYCFEIASTSLSLEVLSNNEVH